MTKNAAPAAPAKLDPSAFQDAWHYALGAGPGWTGGDSAFSGQDSDGRAHDWTVTVGCAFARKAKAEAESVGVRLPALPKTRAQLETWAPAALAALRAASEALCIDAAGGRRYLDTALVDGNLREFSDGDWEIRSAAGLEDYGYTGGAAAEREATRKIEAIRRRGGTLRAAQDAARAEREAPGVEWRVYGGLPSGPDFDYETPPARNVRWTDVPAGTPVRNLRGMMGVVAALPSGEAVVTWRSEDLTEARRAILSWVSAGSRPARTAADARADALAVLASGDDPVRATIAAVRALPDAGPCDPAEPCTADVPCLNHVTRVTDRLLSRPDAVAAIVAAELAEIPDGLDMAGPECPGHPAGTDGPGGETEFCDGSCLRVRRPADRSSVQLGAPIGPDPLPEGAPAAAAPSAEAGGDPEGALLRLPLDCAFDDAWSRDAEGKMVRDDDAEDRLAAEYAGRHGCTVQLLLREGPAGGNPLFCFFGTRQALRSLALDHAGGDAAEADFLLEAAAPLGTPVPEVEARRRAG